jgi:hypothetical protein
MQKYEAVFKTPSPFREFISAINAFGFMVKIDESNVTIELESEDLYDLATTVSELEAELNSVMSYETISISRPVAKEE